MAIPTGNLKGSYDFSNPSSYPGTGEYLLDLSASNNDLRNTTLYGTFGGTGQSKYYTFAGGSDQFIRNNSGLGVSQLYTASVFLWVRSSNWGDTGNKCLAGWGEDINPGGGQISFWKSLTFYGSGNWGMMGSGLAATTFPGGLTANEWLNIGYTADGITGRLYLDGVEVNSFPQNSYISGGTGATAFVSAITGPYYAWISLGGLYSNYYPASAFDLAVAEFYDVTLSGAEVLELYDSQESRFFSAPPPPGPILSSPGPVGGRRFGGRFNG
jgi:hypothetical protein